MSVATILARVKAVVDGVVSVAPDSRVHIGQRRFSTREHWLSVGLDPGFTVPRIHLWVVRRLTSAEESLTLGSNLRGTQVIVEGFYQVYDETENPSDPAISRIMPSEDEFSALVEHVCDHLRNDTQLHGGVAISISAPQATAFDVQTLDEFDCHHCLITFTAQEEKIITWA